MNEFQIFTHFVSQLAHLDCQEIARAAEKRYLVREFKICSLSPAAALSIYRSVSNRFEKCRVKELNWRENELRLFVWTLIMFEKLNGTFSHGPQDHQWEFFGLLFPNKQAILFEYQALSIFRSSRLNKWTPEEDNLFLMLLQSHVRHRWSEIAKRLYIHSNRVYFRAPKQCRERWLNHLDPCKSKEEWQTSEDSTLLRFVRQHGKKWALISKALNLKRNEHAIKNRYKSLITKQAKLISHSNQSQLLQKALLQVSQRERHTNTSESSQQIQDSTRICFLDFPKKFRRAPGICFEEQEESQVSEDSSMRAEQEKQARADSFLVDDPFIQLKVLFLGH